MIKTIVGAEGFIYRGEDTEADVARLEKLIESSTDPIETLEAASKLLGGFGVEDVAVAPGWKELAYVNAGDTYTLTLAHDGDQFLVISWGDWYDNQEEAYQEATGEQRCPYCGEWSAVSRDGETFEDCGHFRE